MKICVRYEAVICYLTVELPANIHCNCAVGTQLQQLALPSLRPLPHKWPPNACLYRSCWYIPVFLAAFHYSLV